MSPCGPRRSSPPTGTPISTRSRRCSPRAGSTRRGRRGRRAEPQRPRLLPPARGRARATSWRAPASSSTRSARLIVIETTNASRLGELEAVALDPAVEKVLFDHHGDAELPEWIDPARAVLSTDGALTTTLVGILAERELSPTPLEATTFALGIHEDTGSLTYATSTQRDADALAWCLRHGARQDLDRGVPAHAAGSGRARSSQPSAGGARADRRGRGGAPARGRSVAEVRGGGLEPRAQDRRPHRYEGRSSSSSRWTGGCSRSCAAAAISSTLRRRGGARWRRACPGRVGDPPGGARRRAQAGASPRSNGRRTEPRRARDVMSTPAAVGRAGAHRPRRDGAVPAPRAERGVRHRERPRRRIGEPRGPRQGDRPRTGARAGARSHERACGHDDRGRDARGAASARHGRRGRPRRRAARRRARGRRRARRSPARARGRRARSRGDRGEPCRRAREHRAPACAVRCGGVARRSRRGRLPRRRHRPRHPPRREELRHRHRGRGRCDRVRARARRQRSAAA